MNLSSLDHVLWAAGFIGHAALLCVLILRGRVKSFPVFTALIGFDTFLTVGLYLLYTRRALSWYERTYWTAAVVDFALQIGVVLEMARIVLKPTGAWIRDARKQFLTWAIAGLAMAALLAWGVSPPGGDAKAIWEIRGNLFTSLVTCELVLAMALSSTRLGLGWRSHVMALGEGLAFWSIAAVAVDSVQSFLGSVQPSPALDHALMLIYCVALAFWIVQFWLPEPARRPISPELRDYILALHRKVTYDLGRVDLES